MLTGEVPCERAGDGGTRMADADVRRLLDLHRVEAVPARYARGVDRRDWDRVRACFDPEGEIVGTFRRGRIAEYLPALIARVEGFGATMHLIGSQEADVDGDRATSLAYGLARHFDDAEGRVERLVVGVEYDDELERRGMDGWVIVRRIVRTLWERRADDLVPRR